MGDLGWVAQKQTLRRGPVFERFSKKVLLRQTCKGEREAGKGKREGKETGKLSQPCPCPSMMRSHQRVGNPPGLRSESSPGPLSGSLF